MTFSILITRPEDDARDLTGKIRTMGFRPFIEPMLTIKPLNADLPDLQNYQALIFTSVNAVRIFADMAEDRTHPVYCTGDFTAETARAQGWQAVTSAKGNAQDLITLLSATAFDPDIPLLHLSGQDIARVIEIPEHMVERHPIYKAEAATKLSPELLDILDNKKLAASLFFSARTAQIFTELLEKYKRTQTTRTIKSLCLGDSVVKSLRHLNWQDVQVAATPDRKSLMALLETLP